MTIENSKEELKAKISEEGLEVELKAYAKSKGKQVNHLSKEDLLSIIESEPITKELTQDEQVNETIILNNSQLLCLVTDHKTSSRPEESLYGRTERFSWGNKHGSASVDLVLNGEPQYLHYGTIRLLRSLQLTSLRKNAQGKEDPKLGNNRFTVTIIDGWSEAELEKFKKENRE